VVKSKEEEDKDGVTLIRKFLISISKETTSHISDIQTGIKPTYKKQKVVINEEIHYIQPFSFITTHLMPSSSIFFLSYLHELFYMFFKQR